MHSLTRRPALSSPIITPGINQCGPFHKLGKFCKVGSICSSALSFSHKPDSLPSSSPSDGSSSNCSLQDSLRSERQEPSTRNSTCCKSIGVLKRHDKPLDGLPLLPRVELTNLNRNGRSSKPIVKKHDPSKTAGSSKRKRVSANRSHRRIEKSGRFNVRNAAKKNHNKPVSKPLPSMIGRRELSKKTMKVLKRRPPFSTSQRNKKSKLNDLLFYRAINQEEPDIGTVEHAGVQGGGYGKGEEEFYKPELEPFQRQDGQDVEMQSQQNESTLWSRRRTQWKRMSTWKKALTVAIPTSLIIGGIGLAAYLVGGANSNLGPASASHGNESVNNVPFPMKEGTTSTGVPSDVYRMNPHVRPTVDLPILDNGRTALMDAAENGDLQVVKELLETDKANPNQSNHFGNNALMYAAQHGHLQVVEKLIDSKANVNQPNKDGDTALTLAAKNGHLQVVEKLIGSKADVHQSDNDGWTALTYAAEHGHLQVVQKLIQLGAIIGQPNNDGKTALMIAAENDHLQVVEKLIGSKADVHQSDNDGWTALMHAAENGHLQVVEKLIDSGTDVHHVAEDGVTTALKLAESNGYSDIEKLLRKSADMGVVSTSTEIISSKLS